MGSTIQDWLDGPSDLKEATVEDVPVPGKSVKVRALPAKFSAQVSGQMKVTTERGEQVATVDVPKMELLQFLHGVDRPAVRRGAGAGDPGALRPGVPEGDRRTSTTSAASTRRRSRRRRRPFRLRNDTLMGRQRPWRFQLPAGVADLYFLCELALELGMTLEELGDRESNYNVCVHVAVFFAERARVREIQRVQQEHEQEATRGRM